MNVCHKYLMIILIQESQQQMILIGRKKYFAKNKA